MIGRMKQYIEMWLYHKKYKKYVRKGYIVPFTLGNGYHHLGDVEQCFNCKSTDISQINIDMINSICCEYDYKCKKCGKILGHFAYGSYQYDFRRGNTR